jgi:hypothetical protein
MVSKVHCPICGFLMMIQIQKDREASYACVNKEHQTN